MVNQTTVSMFTCLLTVGFAGPGSIALGAAQPDSFFLGTVSPLRQTNPIAQASEIGQTAPASTGPVLLAPGTESADVMVLQRQLKLMGLYQDAINGSYGESTQAAVAAFQTSVELPATGILTQSTWEQMISPQLLTQDPAAAVVNEPPVLFPDSGAAAESEPASGPDAAQPDAPEQNRQVAVAPSEADASARSQIKADTVAISGDKAVRRSLPWVWLAGSLGLAISLGSWVVLRQRQAKGQTSLQALGHKDDQQPLSRAYPNSSSQPLPENLDRSSQPLLDLTTNGQPDPSPDRLPPSAETDLALAELPPLSETTRLMPNHLVETLIAELTSPDAAQRHRAVWELGQRGNSSAIQPLVDGLLDADSKERSLILAALAEINSRSLKPMHRALAIALQDQSPEVRKNAIRDLTRVYDVVIQLSQMLAHAAQDPHPEVQTTALWALDQLNRLRPAPGPETHAPALAPDLTADLGSSSTPPAHRSPSS